ncbi:MAG: HEAT repeat domain-containing protein [Candidatus Saganbacteria bacterium]|nr:HEAT repeat domain-containing protein [Candidatus Saganbacteria bacterium]
MKITATKTIGQNFERKGISIPKRSELLQLATRFAEEFSRKCHRNGFFIAPAKIYNTTEDFLKEGPLDRQTWMAAGNLSFCGKLKSSLFKKREDFPIEKIEQLVEETKFLTNLFDWCVTVGLLSIDLVEAAERMAEGEDIERAVLYFKEFVARYDKRPLSVEDYFKVLRALARLEPENGEWVDRILAEEEKLNKLADAAKPEITLAPFLQKELWGEIKGLVFEIMKESPSLLGYRILEHLIDEEDKDLVMALIKGDDWVGEFEFPERVSKLLDLFIKFAAPDEIAGVLDEISSKERHRVFLACHLILKLNYREAIPNLIEKAGIGSVHPDDYLNKQIKETLLTLTTHDDIAPLINILGDLSKRSNEYRIGLVGDLLVDLAKPEDLPYFISTLAKSKGVQTVVILKVIKEIIDPKQRVDINIFVPYLERSEEIATASAKIIAANATKEDAALLTRMREHVYDDVTHEVYEAERRLGLRDDDGFYEIFSGKEEKKDAKSQYALLWEGEENSFVDFVTEEDIKTDHWNLRRMLFVPYSRVVLAAFEVIQRFLPDNVFQDLVEAFKAGDFGVDGTMFSLGVIHDAATVEDLPAVQRMLKDKNEHIKAVAVRIVRKLRAWHLIPQVKRTAMNYGKKTLIAFSEEMRDWESLCGFLNDSNEEVVLSAKEALASIAKTDHLPQLKKMLSDENQNVREAALLALNGILGKDKVQDKEKDKGEGQEKVEKIKLGYNYTTPPTKPSKMLEEVRAMIERPGERMIKTALSVLSDLGEDIPSSFIDHIWGWSSLPSLDDYLKIKKYLQIFARNYSEADLDHLRAVVRNKESKEEEKAIALSALNRLGNHDDLVLFKEYLEKTKIDNAVAVVVANAFASCAIADDLPLIKEMLLHNNLFFRLAAIFAATKLELTELLPIIKNRMNDTYDRVNRDKEAAPLIDWAVIDFLHKFASREEALPLLEEKLNPEEPYFEDAYVKFATEEDLEKALEWLEGDCEKRAAGIKICVKYGHSAALERIKKMRPAASGKLKGIICWAIAKLGSTEEKDSVLGEYKHVYFGDETSRELAQGLVDLWRESDFEFYSEAVREGTRDGYMGNNRDMVKVFYRVLCHIKPDVALGIARDKLQKLLTPSLYLNHEPSIDVSFEILGKHGSDEDLLLIFNQLTHPDHRVREPAARAFGMIFMRSDSSN